jgi:hypothetical protein
MKRFKEYKSSILKEYAGMVADLGPLGAESIEGISSGKYYSVGKTISSFAFPVRSGEEENPIDRYYDKNQQDAENKTNQMIGMLNLTPGAGDNEEEEKKTDENPPIRGMNTNALNMGPAGAADEENRKNIQRAAIERLKDAQERWQFLKTWIKDFDVDPKTQAKIAGLDAVAGINAPSIAKLAKTYILPSGKREEL